MQTFKYSLMKKLLNKKNRHSFVIGILFFIIFLQALLVGKLYSERNHQHYEVNLVQINHEKDSVDLPKMKHHLTLLDRTIRQINGFLINKGTPHHHLQLLTQDSLSDAVYLAKISNRYQQHLIDLEQKLQIIPLGLPSNEGYISSHFGKRKNPIPSAQSTSQIIAEKDSIGNAKQTDIVQNKPNELEQPQFHKGIDIALPYGSDIRCTASGTVIFAGEKGGYGKCVIVSHHNGLATLYAHLSQILTEVNDQVKVNQIIAKSGNSGRSTGPHLHYEILRNNTPVNPKLFLNF